MKRTEYMKRLEEAWATGRITAEAYDAGIMNADIFCDDDEEWEDPRFPEGYAEIEYDDLDSPEAIAGMRFDDMNFARYFER